MPETPKLSARDLPTLFRERVVPVFILAYQFLAAGIVVAAMLVFISWTRKPFIGAFLDPTLVIDAISPSTSGTWPLREYLPSQISAEDFGRQVYGINGQRATTSAELQKLIRQYKVGETVVINTELATGSNIDISITLGSLPLTDRINYFFVPYATGLVYLLASLWMFTVRRRDITGQVYCIFTASVAVTLCTFFDTFTSHQLSYAWVTGLALSGGSIISLAMMFPKEGRLVTRFPFLRWISFVPTAFLIIYAWVTVFDYQRPLAYVLAWRYEYIFVGLGLVVFIGSIVLRYLRPPSPMIHEQARVGLIGSTISFAPIGIWFLITTAMPLNAPFASYLLVTLIAFPIFTAYAILRYRWLNTDLLLSRAALYVTIMILVIAGYGLLVTGSVLVLGEYLGIDSPYFLGALIFIFAAIFQPVRSRLQSRVDAFFSRGQAAYREQLQAFSHDLTQTTELNEILKLLRRYTQNNLAPTTSHLFIFDATAGYYVATPDELGTNAGEPTSDLRFTENSPLPQVMAQNRASIFLAEDSSLPAALLTEQGRLSLLGALLYVPLPGRKKLTGWVALGPRNTGEPYTSRDLAFLETLCDQAALALERAQVIIDLERRIHEMNVLTRVSQGINITVAFDDMLELIYAQTFQVFSAVDFRITLRDDYSGILYHVFDLADDERNIENENRPLHMGEGLEQEVIKISRPIITEDYGRECHNRGLAASQSGIFAWLGVPLNAGAETIGIISVGYRDPTSTFTLEQANLLQAIGDQAAGAIVKARILQESERRARQLSLLNEVARSMSSTLELAPLLNQILQSAVDILNCEAGSLLLVDQVTGEMIFEVVTNPVANTLLGTRLPPGTGLVGRAVESKQPVIANDARRAKEWFEKPDASTGFTTRDLMVIPMLVKDVVIGLIEVINRKDGLPFTPGDQELLTAFASQAGIAIENARLYTQTDQTLAARVEELSVMQRIDRELNASLDTGRAMRITLEWAMRQSRADAGLVGIIENDKMRITASQGYTKELNAYPDGMIPLTLAAIQKTLESGQQKLVQDLNPQKSSEDATLLRGAKTQIATPIRREAQVTGVLLLESKKNDPVAEDMLSFLMRLSDHAVIAIANAQLYAEVQAANLAKSDFVSFVSHELKNPMTSIRGFTDLLAKGAVGQVNEAQSNFLSTIRSNVDRMAVLVSDLADVSRIEAGRLKLDFAALPLIEIVEEVVRSIQAQVQEKAQSLSVQIPVNLPPAWGDRTRLAQIITNLVSNAHKYTPQGGKVTIEAEACANRWDDQGATRVIHLSVADTGYGISPEGQKKLFQKFYRVPGSENLAPGTGLGLNITKTLVEMQGGRIWFESEVQKGTTFHFTIPVVEST